jgi:uncharacterized repeat protein (TIGR01451 family)
MTTPEAAHSICGDVVRMTQLRPLGAATRVAVLVALAALVGVAVVASGVVHAQSYPPSSYFNYDSTHLYLRLETYGTPQFPAVGARFKWLIDVGIGNNLYWSGQNILGADFILFVEDSGNDGGRDVYLLDAQGNDNFTQYEPTQYKLTPGPVTDTSVAGFNQTGNNIDLWVSFSALGVSDPAHASLIWSTDQENPNLEQGPIVDSTDLNDTPIHLDADLNVAKDVSDHIPLEGASITYTITVTNTGPADATNIQLTDLLPGGVTYSSHSPSQGTYVSGTGVWSVGTLVDGASATLSIAATVDSGTAGSTITNTASVTSVDQPDSHAGDNSDSVDIFPNRIAPPDEADLHITKDVDDHIAGIGDTVTYAVTVVNEGPAAATSVQVSDPLPDSVTYVSDTPSQGSYDSGSDLWAVGNLADGGSATLTITATVNSGTAGSTVTNTATASAASPTDPDPSDNSDTAEFFVNEAPPPSGTVVAPVFPSPYIGIAAAFAAAVLASVLRSRLTILRR